MRRLAIWAMALILLAGCGDRPKLVPAAGKLTHKGQPLTAGSVIFVPDAGNAWAKDNPSSLLQTDGSFTMKTFPYGDGVSPGKYKVTLDPALAGRIRQPALSKADKTPWSVEIPDTGKTDISFEAKGK
jgi:hypothetical protein